MRKVKWIFFAYLGFVVLMIGGIALSFSLVPGRDQSTIYVSYYSNLRSLDPIKITDVVTAQVAGHVYENLYNYDYKKRPFTLLPEIAKGMPELSTDGKTMTVHLKRGIHYFDPNDEIPGWEQVKDEKGVVLGRKGPEIVSGDFIYGWKRISDFHLNSPQFANIFQGKIEGIDDWWEYTRKQPKDAVDYDRPISGLQTPDPQTLIIRLVTPFPQFEFLLAHTPTTPISREAVSFYG